eukprot:Blabericola_migrator_1__5084@NODE_2630_length_2514_cov_48_321618_g1650_i0_p1_GENE_NODE_2630_length_2514_cov_48_321618_g1650_i0NODE_2630_length_2514_cov_48_321618_g1650_i0_p1_ORF_typecomplete_len144_score21_17_NODE_2630_length_2514_cov_48_321618_g1650_i0201632
MSDETSRHISQGMECEWSGLESKGPRNQEMRGSMTECTGDSRGYLVKIRDPTIVELIRLHNAKLKAFKMGPTVLKLEGGERLLEVVVMSINVVIWGRTIEEHEKNLFEDLKCMNRNGLYVNIASASSLATKLSVWRLHELRSY